MASHPSRTSSRLSRSGRTYSPACRGLLTRSARPSRTGSRPCAAATGRGLRSPSRQPAPAGTRPTPRTGSQVQSTRTTPFLRWEARAARGRWTRHAQSAACRARHARRSAARSPRARACMHTQTRCTAPARAAPARPHRTPSLGPPRPPRETRLPGARSRRTARRRPTATARAAPPDRLGKGGGDPAGCRTARWQSRGLRQRRSRRSPRARRSTRGPPGRCGKRARTSPPRRCGRCVRSRSTRRRRKRTARRGRPRLRRFPPRRRPSGGACCPRS
mmetsp:Transcript_11972/g.40015  ORF Transcript_11972/g.40015 Transcript_11972/m.40015 type:complete len:275 (-) Transcript_11972:1744-2568(-)